MPRPNRKAGRQLRLLRETRGLSMRQVHAISKRIAKHKGSRDFLVSSSVLSLIERHGLIPTIFRLHTLGRAYGVPIRKLLGLFEV